MTLEGRTNTPNTESTEAQPNMLRDQAAAPTVITTDRRANFSARNGMYLGTGLLAGALLFSAIGGIGKSEASNNAAGYSPSPSATELATQKPSEAGATPTMPEVSPSATPEVAMKLSITPAQKDANGNWIINTPDAEAKTITAVEGFTPDSSLVLAPEWGKGLKLDPAKFADFQKSLNDPKNPLVGYTYGENDQSDNLDYRRTLQAPMYSWTVMTGLEVDAPGIGHLKGGTGTAVELMILNITDKVYAFGSENPVMIKDGFTGTGRIWDGNNVINDEQGISSHYVSRLQNGVTLAGESGFIGQCDEAKNCDKVLVVSVVRRQWGNKEDGTPRYQFQLVRQELVSR